MTRDKIQNEYTQCIERHEREYDAGAIDPAQFDALVHAARVRRDTALDKLICTPSACDRLADTLIRKGLTR